jgi:hypothetical protein
MDGIQRGLADKRRGGFNSGQFLLEQTHRLGY